MPTRHAVFLRAINVGTNRLTMADLAARIDALGFTEVTTYLPTGNVMLTDPGDRGPAEVAAVLDEGLAATGLKGTDAVVWAPADLVALTANSTAFDPYPPEEWRRYASFLREPPARDGRDRVEAKGPTVVYTDDRVIFAVWERGLTGFTPGIEPAYKVRATARWWNVVCDFADKHCR